MKKRNFERTGYFFAVAITLVVFSCLTVCVLFIRPAAADAPARPSFKEVLTEKTHGGEDIAAVTRDLIERGRVTIEEIDTKIVIRWRGPKKNDLFGESVKARARSVSGFRVYKSTNQFVNFVMLAQVAADSSGYYKYEDFDLENDRIYFYKITLVDSDGVEHFFLPQFQAAARDVNKPAQPDKPDIESGDGFVKLSWKPYGKQDFYEYQILRSDAIGGEHELISRIRERGVCRFVDSEVVNGKSYSYVMRIVDRGGNESRISNEAIGRPKDMRAPPVPKNLKVEPGNNMVTLSWERSDAPDCEAYKIYWCEGEPSPTNRLKLLTKTPASDSFVNGYQVKNLKNGKIYYFSVAAVDFSGNESATTVEAKGAPVDFTAPPAPSYIKVSALNAANMIEWASVPDADGDLGGYRIYRKSTAFPKFIAIADVKKPRKSDTQIHAMTQSGAGNRSIDKFYPVIYQYEDKGLYNAMAYYYYVVAYDNKGNESRASAVAEGIPRDRVAPEKVSGFNASSRIAKIVLSWKPNRKDRDLLGYLLYRRAESESEYALIAEIKKADQTVFEDINLEYGVKYHYRVSAFDESLNESVASDEKSATAKFPNQVSFSRAYVANRPGTYCYSVNLNEMSLCGSKSFDNVSWSQWSEVVKFPPPPNMGKMTQLSVQKWSKGILIFSYNPMTLDLYFVNSPDEKTFPAWRLLFNRIELPPNFGRRCAVSFEKDENAVMAFAYNPLTQSVYYSMSRDMESFLRWMPCGLKVAPPPDDTDSFRYFVTADDRGNYLFAYDPDGGVLSQSMSFDKKHWKAWYKFAQNLKKPKNLEKDAKNQK